ncbi:MAG: hypothetical protein ACJA1B_000678 [Polaribacter sp.]|jgi:hypothetical protein
MEYKEKIRLLDLVFKNIENTERFDIVEILTSKTDFNEKESKDFQSFLKPFEIRNDLFEILTNTKVSTLLKLTLKGEELKNFKKGFLKFENKDKQKKSLYLNCLPSF